MTASGIIDVFNVTMAFISIIMAVVVIAVSFRLRMHSRRMGWLIIAVCVLVGGLSNQIASFVPLGSYGYLYRVCARTLYALVAPLFCLYFIETERDEGTEWDGYFWTIFHGLLAVLVAILAIGDVWDFIQYSAFLAQYLLMIVMILISSKNIRESIGFLVAILFPVSTAVAGITNYNIHTMGFGIIMLLLIVYFCYQVDMERELLKRQAELSDSRISLMMDQIHPHFIYNSLQQIALLCDENPKDVKNAIYNFSGYLRSNFEALTNERMIPFEEEMKHVDMYLALAEILPSREFKVEKRFEVTDFLVPALVVQPLVENAVQYGISMSTSGDRILIETKEEKGFIIISVSDDGHGMKTEISTQRKHKSVGTKNVKTRLKILCDGELTINKGEKGTKSVIKMPAANVKNVN